MTDPTFFGPELYGKVIDDTMIIQHNHGPFNEMTAPRTAGSAFDSHGLPLGVSRDHWAAFVQKQLGPEYDVTALNTATLIREWRERNGNGLWKIKEDVMKDAFEQAGLGRAKWEDVRMDGSSDGVVFGNTKPELIPGFGADYNGKQVRGAVAVL